MAIDVVIRQKLLGFSPMPLAVILGQNLYYGAYENERLQEGQLGENEFIAYHPQHIGRGFSVVWKPGEKKQVVLRLPLPSTTQELSDFYAAVERMMKYWGGSMTVDGVKMTLADFMAGFRKAVVHSRDAVRQLAREILDGKQQELMFYAVMMPLTMGKEEASLFLEDAEQFSAWLHEKQAMDVYFSHPYFLAGDNGTFGRFVVYNDIPGVYPCQPAVPLGITDLATGQPLVCRQWTIWVGLAESDEPLCELDYAQFVRRIPENKKTRYDERHFLLSALTEEELRKLFL